MDHDAFGNETPRRESVGPPGTPAREAVAVVPAETTAPRQPSSWIDRVRTRLSANLPKVSGSLTINGEISPELHDRLETILSAEHVEQLDRGETVTFGDPGVAEQVRDAVSDAAAAGPSFSVKGELTPEMRTRLGTILGTDDLAKLARGETIHVANADEGHALQKLLIEAAGVDRGDAAPS